MIYPDTMDPECIPLCDALNALPGICTRESCCGHGKHTHMIFFTAQTVESLRPLLVAISSSAWQVIARWANGGGTIYFLLEGPVGPPDMPDGANYLAARLTAETV